jgi:hypothetical protein
MVTGYEEMETHHPNEEIIKEREEINNNQEGTGIHDGNIQIEGEAPSPGQTTQSI